MLGKRESDELSCTETCICDVLHGRGPRAIQGCHGQGKISGK